jgi:endonuclease YncB( thermonuclease family)
MRKILVIVVLAWLGWILATNSDVPSPGASTVLPGGLIPTPPEAEASGRTDTVAYVIDGDTVVLASGLTVRLRGIDAPEREECASARSTRSLARLIRGERVRLVRAGDDRDRYGRLLRYVDLGRTDAGLRQIKRGLAIARYDSRDGYGAHPREDAYVAADRRSPDFVC